MASESRTQHWPSQCHPKKTYAKAVGWRSLAVSATRRHLVDGVEWHPSARREVTVMAEHGEWTRKGAVLSEKTAQAEYGVDRSFIIEGIESGKLEYRLGVMWGTPYLRLLRSQLEKYVAERHGSQFLATTQLQTELKSVNRELAKLKRRIGDLESRKADLERSLANVKKKRRRAQR